MSFECWIFSHFIWSHRVAASLGNCSLHPIVTAVCLIPSHLISPHVVSSQNFPPRLISSHLISCPLSFSHLFTADHNSSHLYSLRLSLSHLFSAHLNSSLFSSSQLLHSTQLVSTQLFSCQVVSAHPISTYPAHLSSSQLTLRSSQLFSGPKPVPKPDPGAKATKGYKRYDFEFWRLCNSKFTVKKDNGNKKLIVATLAQPFQWDLQAASCKRP